MPVLGFKNMMYSRLISGGKKIFLAIERLLTGIQNYGPDRTTSVSGNRSIYPLNTSRAMSRKIQPTCISRTKLLLPLKAIGLIVVLLLSSGLAQATTYTWTGATSTDWATSTNWSPNGNPGSAVGDIVS